jgi:hypothetical protein
MAAHPAPHAPDWETGPDVVLLAALAADNRLDVLRPPPARLEDGAPDGQLAQLDQFDASLIDTPYLIGSVEALMTQLHEPIVRIAAPSA